MLNFNLLAPELTLAATAVVVILLDLFVRQKWVLAGVSILGLAVSGGFTLSMCLPTHTHSQSISKPLSH